MDNKTTPDLLASAVDVRVKINNNEILQGATVSIAKGEVVTIVGPNGAGKTTLIRAMLGLIRPDSGKIYRRPGLKIGYMPQKLNIDPTMPMTVNRFLELGVPSFLTGHGRRKNTLEEVNISHISTSQMQNISGGEMQRVMLARALLRDPDFLVLDEPVQGVDITGQAELYRLIRKIKNNRGVGVLMVSHDLHVVMAETDRVICLNRHVCCEGHPEAVSRHPEFVEMFGEQVANSIALYPHHHDHHHDVHGDVHGNTPDATHEKGHNHDG
ncbi:MAG: metal ABC transporter ATP-binding protein [Rhodospirillaceae bacterium]|nr:metal ABC transporter ATP-binding protein [Rhodospirillaceae bacterium]